MFQALTAGAEVKEPGGAQQSWRWLQGLARVAQGTGGDTEPQPAGSSHIWEPLCPQIGQAEVEVVSGSGWGFARAQLGTTTRGSAPLQGPSRAQVRASHEEFACRTEPERHKTQCRKVQRGEQQALALGGTAGNGSFHEKKLPGQTARHKLRVWLLPGAFFLQHLQPPGPPWALLSGWELRSSEQSRHSHIQEPLSWSLHVHTQARKEPAGTWQPPAHLAGL